MSSALLGLALKAKLHSQTRKLVLMQLVDSCREDGTRIYPSLATISDAAECSVQTARRVMKAFCAVGLLRKVREGGSGPGSTAHYEMDTELLYRLRRPELWPALEAAAVHEPLPDSDDDEPAGHARDAEPQASEPGSHAEKKGATVEGFHGGRLPNPAEGYHPDDTQPLSRTLRDSERERAQERESAPASEGEPDGRPSATLDDFRKAYPHAGADDQAALRSAWEAVPFAERQAAVDGIPGFVAERKAAGFASRLSGPKYLSGFNWRHLPQQASERAAKQAAGAFVELKGWSRDWWLILLARIADGQRQRVSFAVSQADAGKSISVPSGDIAAALKRIGELKSFLCNGPEIDAWRPWLAERGARIPVFAEGASFRVFLPSEGPPGGRVDDGDAEVTF